MAVGGLTNMFVYDDYRLIAFDGNDGWARDAVHVFEGDFTVRMPCQPRGRRCCRC